MNDNILVADIEGYASVFDERDLNGDVIDPGAFAKSLKASVNIKMLYQHMAEAPIGRWTSFTKDRRGLFVTGEILLSSPRAREVHALLAGRALDGLSIGYQTVRARKNTRHGGRKDERRIIEAALWEVSIVTFPMAPGARVTHVGSPRPEECRRVSPLARPARESAHGMSGPLRRPGGRASADPQADVRHFADALRSAATIISV